MAKMSYDRRKWGRLVTGLAVFAPLPAAALTININAGADLLANTAALTAFNSAAAQWETIFTDPITVTIDANLTTAGFSNPNTIGQASSVMLAGGYTTLRNQIVADAAAEPDDTIVASLPTAAQFSALVPSGFSLNGNVAGTKANLKALGFGGLDATYGATDATITFNSAFSFDYDNSNGVGAGLMDFQTVAAHEIGHALGFVSAVDDIDYLKGQGRTAAVSLDTLDLFRFDTAPTSAAQFTTNARDLTTGGSSLFSDTSLALAFSTGAFTGDGNQASHWKANEQSGVQIGIMDPTLALGQLSPITANDIRALDVIGWDVVPVPVPAALFLFAPALAGLFGIGRKSRASLA